MNIYLHIGMPKCGSSALQTFLCSQDFINIAGTKVAYAIINDNGDLIVGKDVNRMALVSSTGYCSSTDWRKLFPIELGNKIKIINKLKKLSEKYDSLILSREGWGTGYRFFENESIFSDDLFNVTVVSYFRPQVEWINSGWWQWGAWSDININRWIKHSYREADWTFHFNKWCDIPWVNKTHFRVLKGDIVRDFLEVIGLDCDSDFKFKVNTSLPSLLLRVFQRNRILRPGPHDSAIEFVLSRRLSLPKGKTPWVLSKQQVQSAIDYFKPKNKELLDLLDDENRNHILSDARWWDADYYNKYTYESPSNTELNVEDLEKLSVHLINSLVEMDKEIRLLKRKSNNKG